MRIDKEEIWQRLVMPQYLRFAMRDTIHFQDPTATKARFHERTDLNVGPPEAPVVVFINACSGGRHKLKLKERLHQLIAEEQVFDLKDVKPHEYVQYGLKCLEMLAGIGDSCAKDTRERLRVVGYCICATRDTAHTAIETSL
ncbi:diacylglycerol kinase 3 [Quercus suber]|uniref:Diacylglycerol kinase 3 n=1 Tax=Quercus suber TaxID=58331 RepID=A0AAW0M690_QUESU|nr:diacylglycerol kinase 3 [Quercus suber]POE94098.1 diacylglycerol kinase 3 [Quercus suber]